jgi:N-glycosylase/DNA lyase
MNGDHSDDDIKRILGKRKRSSSLSTEDFTLSLIEKHGNQDENDHIVNKRIKTDPPQRDGIKTEKVMIGQTSMDKDAYQPHSKWTALNIPARELRCSQTLNNGQCFQWRPFKTKQNEKIDQWIGVVDSFIVILKEVNDDTWFRLITPEFKDDSTLKASAIEKMKARLYDYFQISLGKLEKLIKKWNKRDSHFLAKQSPKLQGLRLLQLDPLECLLSFICSSNNNIKRIHNLVDSLRSEYGQYLSTVKGISYYQFPTLDRLHKKISETRLRELGFGYRAPYLVETIQTLKQNGGIGFLEKLRDDDDMSSDQKSKILSDSFLGVGPKVADCVTLMSLKGYDRVPIDTHIFRVYQEQYCSTSTHTKLTKKMSEQISHFFQKKFGKLAGWAQSFLFSSQLS